MYKKTSIAQTVLLAILLATVGFSYSLATSNSDSASGEVAARALGSGASNPLAFANPFVSGSTDRDLGDAVAGSALTRLVRAKGGIAPYSFTAGTTATSGLTAVSTTLVAAQIQLLTDGILTQVGTQTSPKILSGPFRFSVTVKDSFGTAPHSLTNTFRLTFVSSTSFRFANSTFVDGVQYQPYSDSANTINGAGPIKYTLVSSIPAITGLGIADDGEVYGVPIVSGTVTLTIAATDKNGKVATNRAGTGSSQVYTLKVTAGNAISSVISSLKIVVNQGNGTGKDAVTYTGVANLGGTSLSALAGGNLSLRIGSYTGPTAKFASFGSGVRASTTFRGAPHLPLPVQGAPHVIASVSRFGLTRISVSRDTINVGAPTGASISLPVEVRLGSAAIGSEYLTFTVKSGNNGSKKLTYDGTVSNDTAGSFQLLKVLGADSRDKLGDSFKVSFLARVPSTFAPASATSVNIAVGVNSNNTVTLTNNNGVLSGAKTAAITSFKFDTSNKGLGSYTTGELLTSATAIPLGAKGTSPFFSTSLSFMTTGTTVGYELDGSLKIFSYARKYISQ